MAIEVFHTVQVASRAHAVHVAAAAKPKVTDKVSSYVDLWCRCSHYLSTLDSAICTIPAPYSRTVCKVLPAKNNLTHLTM